MFDKFTFKSLNIKTSHIFSSLRHSLTISFYIYVFSEEVLNTCIELDQNPKSQWFKILEDYFPITATNRGIFYSHLDNQHV